MNINDELNQWGEAPLTAEEEALLPRLGPLLEALTRGESPPETAAEPEVLRLLRRLQQTTWSFRREAGLLDHHPDERGTLIQAALPDPFPGEYRIVRKLGKGAFGQVWLAEEILLDHRPVALKTLKAPGDPVQLESLKGEAKVIGKLEHRNLVRVHTCRVKGPDVWLVLQYVKGGSLEDRLEQHGPLSWQNATRYVADVAEGLRHAHAAGVIHRDIKPSNILWDEARDEALLTDFGAAARGDDGMVAGTLYYMAPEGFEGKVSPKRDVYSLAATLFRLLTKDYPFPGPTKAALKEQARKGLAADDARCNDLPGPLMEVIREGLKADPLARPGLDEFGTALRGALNRLLSDDLGAKSAAWLHLTVRRTEAGVSVLAATTRTATAQATRNMAVKKKAPPPPETVRLRTGDVVRVEVESERAGYVTVFNVGPTGDLNLLYPEDLAKARGAAILAGRPLEVLEVEMQPPAGRERLFVLWTVRPLPLREEDLRAVAAGKELALSSSYVATRNMARVQQAVQGLKAEEWAAAVLEVEHGE